MKLINLERGTEILLFPFEEVRPFGGVHLVDFVSAAQERYQFLGAPDLSLPVRDLHAKALEFAEGKLDRNGKTILIQELNIHRDGIVVRSPYTDDCDLIVSDALEWARREFGLREFITPPTKRFGSSVVVDFDKNIDGLIGANARLGTLISDCLRQHRGIELSAQVQRLAYAVDPTKLLAGVVVEAFLIERRAEAPYELNRYFSDAPLPTQAHLDFLQQIEMLG